MQTPAAFFWVAPDFPISGKALLPERMAGGQASELIVSREILLCAISTLYRLLSLLTSR